jgi:hypothetical protein
LAHCIGAVHFEAVASAAEGFQQAPNMKRRADKQQFRIIRLAGLTAPFIGPEEDTVRVIDEQRCAELVEQTGGLARQLAVGNPGRQLLELLLRSGHGK